MLSQEQLEILVSEIVQRYRPDKVYLFGSYANCNASWDSDIDLFIIKSTKTRKINWEIEVRQAIKSYPMVGMDTIVYTPEEMEIAEKDVANIGKVAIATGKLMYEII